MLLLDTQAWAWSLFQSSRLPARMKDALATATDLWVSPVSLYEIAQKARLGKWPDMVAHVADLTAHQRRQGVWTAALTPEIALLAGSMTWGHRDPFDRIIAATAQVMGIPLASTDSVFDSVPGGLRRVC